MRIQLSFLLAAALFAAPSAAAQPLPSLPDTLVWERLPGPRTEDSLAAAVAVFAEADSLYTCYWGTGTAARRTIAGPNAASPSDFEAWEPIFGGICSGPIVRPTTSGPVFFLNGRRGPGLLRSEGFSDPDPDFVNDEAESAPIATASGVLVVRHEEGFGTGTARSVDGGRTWQVGTYVAGSEASVPASLAYVPPSPGLPLGRIVGAGPGGIAYSDDEGVTWLPSNVFGDFSAYMSDVIRIKEGPFAGRLLATGDTFVPGTPEQAILASDDGVTWEIVGGLSGPGQLPLLYRGPGGVVFAAPDGPNVPIEASADGGETWQQMGVIAVPSTDEEAEAYYVWDLALGGDGHLYAAVYWRNFRNTSTEGNDGGVYRTTARLPVASEPRPEAPADGLGVRAYPNPSGGAVTVALQGNPAGAPVRVALYDGLGREVAVLHDGPAAERARFTLEHAVLAPGPYVARVQAGEASAAAVFTVAE